MECKKLLYIILAAVMLLSFSACDMKASDNSKPSQKTVVVYTSVDQVYSEKVFNRFEAETGIKVLPVYDIEANKTVGLANRLISEKAAPQADVFWSGEILNTLDLKAKGVLGKADISASKDLPASFVDTDGQWFAFGGRARVLLVNKSLISIENCPKTMEALPNDPNIKNGGIAYPVFGTTATQAAALYAFWGDEKAKAYYQSLKDSGIQVLEGNSVVKDQVSQKKLFYGLTDTDDAFSEMDTNKDLDIILMDQQKGGMGTLVTPNTVALINGAPHPIEGDSFMEYLLSANTEQQMVDDGWIQIPVHKNVTHSTKLGTADIKIMPVDFALMYTKLEVSKNDMTKIFAK